LSASKELTLAAVADSNNAISSNDNNNAIGGGKATGVKTTINEQ
jgi:hypothetical protein